MIQSNNQELITIKGGKSYIQFIIYIQHMMTIKQVLFS